MFERRHQRTAKTLRNNILASLKRARSRLCQFRSAHEAQERVHLKRGAFDTKPGALDRRRSRSAKRLNRDQIPATALIQLCDSIGNKLRAKAFLNRIPPVARQIFTVGRICHSTKRELGHAFLNSVRAAGSASRSTALRRSAAATCRHAL